MRFNKTIQIGLLLCLYLDRAGRAKIEDVAASLGVSSHFLSQIAVKLRRAGMVTTVRGPGGGYQLNPQATAWNVVNILGRDNMKVSSNVTTEYRALDNLILDLRLFTNSILDVHFDEINQALVTKEVSSLEDATFVV